MTEGTAAPAAPAPTLDNFRDVVQHNLRQAKAAEGGQQQQERAPARAARQQPQAEQEPEERDPVADALGDDPLEGDELADDDAPLEGDEEAVSDLLEEELHGHKGRAILEALKAGGLPAELLAQIKATAKVNGQDVAVTLQEALEGYQRTSDYTRGKKEARDLTRKAQERIDAVNDLIGSWDSGEKLLAGVKRLGKMKGFREAAIAFAKEEWEDEQMRTKNPEAHRVRQELRQERERREALEEQARDRPDPRAERATSQFAEQLQKLVPGSFAKHGIKDTRFARGAFSENFRAIYDPDVDLEQQVELASRATAEELSDLAERHAKAQEAGNGATKRPRGPLSAKAQAAPTAGQPRVPRRMTPGEMEEHLRSRRAGKR